MDVQVGKAILDLKTIQKNYNMKTWITYMFILTIFLINCKQDAKKDDFIENIHTDFVSQDTIAIPDFINYPIDSIDGIVDFGDGVFRNYDYSRKQGEVLFIIVSKIGKTKWKNYIEKKYKNLDYLKTSNHITDSLSKLSLKELSKEFNLWVFFTPKKYLKYTPNLDTQYTPQIPREIFLYQYDPKKDLWNVYSSYKVEGGNDHENKWLNEKIEEISNKLNKNSINDWFGTYLNSDNNNLSSYQDIKNRIGWYEIIIKSDIIVFKNDHSILNELPKYEQQFINTFDFNCNYQIKEDTLILYAKELEEQFTKPVNEEKGTLLLKLYKKNNLFYGISNVIDSAENSEYNTREKSKPPYLFKKFNQ